MLSDLLGYNFSGDRNLSLIRAKGRAKQVAEEVYTDLEEKETQSVLDLEEEEVEQQDLDLEDILEDQGEILDLVARTTPEDMTHAGYVRQSTVDAVVQKVDPSKMEATFVIVTRQSRPNLHGNKVQITPAGKGKGLVTEVHQKCPIVLFEHGVFPFPIAMSEKNGKYTVKLNSKRAVATAVFSQTLPEASLIFALIEEGILRMASIGYIPLKAKMLKGAKMELGPDEDGILDFSRVGFDFIESLLLEWSIVSLGADQGAFRQLLDKGQFRGEKLTAPLVPVFQKLAGPKKAQGVGFTFPVKLVPTEKKVVTKESQMIEVSEDEDQVASGWVRISFGGNVPCDLKDVCISAVDLAANLPEIKEDQGVLAKARTPKYSGTETRKDQPWQKVDKSLSAFIKGLLSGVDPNTNWSDLSQSQRAKLSARTLLGNPSADTSADGLAFPVVNPANDKLNEGGLLAAKAAAGGARGAKVSPEQAKSIVSVCNRLLEKHFGHKPKKDSVFEDGEDLGTEALSQQEGEPQKVQKEEPKVDQQQKPEEKKVDPEKLAQQVAEKLSRRVLDPDRIATSVEAAVDRVLQEKKDQILKAALNAAEKAIRAGVGSVEIS